MSWEKAAQMGLQIIGGFLQSKYQKRLARTKARMIKQFANYNANVANAAKNDMIKQMKTVREIPTSQSSANSTKVNKTQDDAIFESILGLDEGIDNLFG